MKPFFYVHYVEGCSPKLKRLRTTKALKRWTESFNAKNQGNPDAWIEFVIEGRLVSSNEHYKGMVL